MNVNLFIPTLNAGERWNEVLESIEQQKFSFQKKVIIDSGSTDRTLDAISGKGFEVIHVDKKAFDHGGTRHTAISRYPDADCYLFLTQDAILFSDNAVQNMVRVIEELPDIGMAYGRQLPHKNAKLLEKHARIFNYPDQSQIRSLKDADQYGIKTISCSNSFAAYRSSAYHAVGGFPSGTILGEDVVVAGKMLMDKWKMAYVADASVYHSHDYSISEEFKRYFDIGIFHKTNSWIFDYFGKADNEGFRYLKSEMTYVIKNNVLLLPKACTSVIAKWLGYKMGLRFTALPISLSKKMSMHKAYWNTPRRNRSISD